MGNSDNCSKGRCIGISLAVLLLGTLLGLVIWLGVEHARCKNSSHEEQSSIKIESCDAPSDNHSVTGEYRYASVAADAKICSQIGTSIMGAQGGSAMDAAIASLLCLGVVQPHSTGIGGGFIMTVYDRTNDSVWTLNSREVAPMNATEDMFVGNGVSAERGGMSIAVPSEIAGMAEAHVRYGKLPWAKLVEPTIRICEEGFEVTYALSKAVNTAKKSLEENPPLGDVFLPGGIPVKTGDIMTRPLLAATLRTIAEEGPYAFYNGTLAAEIVDDVQDRDGILTLEDLSSYEPVWKEPVSVTLDNGGYTLYGPPPPSSAVIVHYILNILDGYGMSEGDRSSIDKEVLTIHRMLEALKFGLARYSEFGDEDYVNVSEWKSLLLSDTYADRTRSLINDSYVLSSYGSDFELDNTPGTSHLSVYGPDGSVVSVTSTINTYFGSYVMGSRTGIIFNNAMDDFSTPNTKNHYGVPASPMNYIVLGKRPMSSMSPLVVMNSTGDVRLVVGAAGGPRIISCVPQVVMNNLWLGFNLTAAVDRVRFFYNQANSTYGEVRYETEKIGSDYREALEHKGHQMRTRRDNLYFGVSQAIQNTCQGSPETRPCDQECVVATSDVRKRGAPDGF